MIQIPSPNFALNDSRCPGQIRMDNSSNVYPNDPREWVIDSIVGQAANAPGKYLKSLVINCHGAPGYLILGQGFSHAHTGMFQKLRGKVGTIWITACRLASRKYADPKSVPLMGSTGEVSDGFLFCKQIAINAGCNVVASLNDQEVPKAAILPGFIDSYEGAHFCWKADGSLAWARQFGTRSFE